MMVMMMAKGATTKNALSIVYVFQAVNCFSESCQVEKLKGLLQKAGKPNGFALLDSTGHLPQKLLVAGYDTYSMYDLG